MTKLLYIQLLILMPAIALTQSQYLNPLSGSHTVVTISDSLQRPNNATAYTAKDAINDSVPKILTFPNAARTPGGMGYITGAILEADTTVVTNGSIRLYIWDDSLAAIADNAPFTLLAANSPKLVCYVDFVLATGGTGSTTSMDVVGIQWQAFRTVSDDRNLYGTLVAEAAYVPTNRQWFRVRLKIHRW